MPTTGIKPSDPITFKVRDLPATDGEETRDFGDGTLPPSPAAPTVPAIKPLRQGRLRHRDLPIRQAGPLPCRVERANARQGAKAIARLHVVMDEAETKQSTGLLLSH